MPRLDRTRSDRLAPIPGTPPSLINVPSGCPFHPRCGYAARLAGRCETEVPELRSVALDHQAACHLPADEQQKNLGRAGQDPARAGRGPGEDA